MSNIFVEIFNGHEIRFEKYEDGSLKGCLSDMAKAADRRVNNYLRLPSTKELIMALQGDDSNIIQIREGRYGGTWSLEAILIDFAYWSNLEFRLWVIHVILKLKNQGLVTMQQKGESSEDYEERNRILVETNQQLLMQVKEMKSWCPFLPVHKIRLLNIINYHGSEYSPFLNRAADRDHSVCEDYEIKQYQNDVKRQKLFQDLLDTLFTGQWLDLYTNGFRGKDNYTKFCNSIPEKLYRVLTNPYQGCSKQQQPKPPEDYKQFQFSIELKRIGGSVRLEYIPEKEEMLKEFLFASEKELVA